MTITLAKVFHKFLLGKNNVIPTLPPDFLTVQAVLDGHQSPCQDTVKHNFTQGGNVEAEQKDRSFGFKDFWIGVVIGLVAACLGIWFTKAAGITPMWAWLALGFLGILVGLARRWREAGHDLISLSAGFLLSFGISVIVTWDITQGIWPTVSGTAGFYIGAFLRTLAKPKPAT